MAPTPQDYLAASEQQSALEIHDYLSRGLCIAAPFVHSSLLKPLPLLIASRYGHRMYHSTIVRNSVREIVWVIVCKTVRVFVREIVQVIV